MSDTATPDENEVLRRMLNTPHAKHKPLKERDERPAKGIGQEETKPR